jgi:hypothetical protein
MSCNAWNHPPNCNCGWGGVFHGLGITSGRHYWQKSESYTNPNANCPRCRAKVFYYESPYGGKVYFDQMGPPWPKHPCMDSHGYGASHTKVTGRKVGVSFISQPQTQPINIEEGWIPVYCFEIQASDRLPDYLDFSLFDMENRKHLYAKYSRQLVDSRSPILIRRIKDQLNYEISTLNVREAKPTEIRLFAFTTIEEAEGYEISHSQQSTEKGETSKPIVKRVMQRIGSEPTQRTILHVTNRNIPVRVKKQPTQIQKSQRETIPSKKSLVASQKRKERAQKREEREQESNKKVQVKTALEIAFDEAKGKH